MNPSSAVDGRQSILTTDPYAVTRHPIGTARTLLRQRRERLVLPPGPRGAPFTGVLKEFQADPFTLATRYRDRYGDVFRVPMAGFDIVFVNRPEHVAHIMAENEGRYSMVGPLEASMHTRLGAGLPIMEGPRFKHRRRLLTPLFRNNSLADMAPAIVEMFDARMSRWAATEGQMIDLQEAIADLTLPAILKLIFSIEPGDRELRQIDEDVRTLFALISAGVGRSRMPQIFPWPGRQSVVAAAKRTWRWINQRVEHRLAHPNETSDWLDYILAATEEDGTPLSRRDILMELFLLTAGGYETVVASTSWTVATMRDNHEALEALIAEADQLDSQLPTYSDLARLTWTKACFDEGQRLQGHPMHPRIAMRDDTIDGFHIPKHTVLGVSMYALHRDPRWWDRPDTFDPTRFTDKAVVSARPSLAFIPFGAGRHRCIGSQMGYMNGQFILAMLHQRFRIEVADDWQPRHAATFSCTIKGGLPARLHTRQRRLAKTGIA